jgi:hypothetical protein
LAMDGSHQHMVLGVSSRCLKYCCCRPRRPHLPRHRRAGGRRFIGSTSKDASCASTDQTRLIIRAAGGSSSRLLACRQRFFWVLGFRFWSLGFGVLGDPTPWVPVPGHVWQHTSISQPWCKQMPCGAHMHASSHSYTRSIMYKAAVHTLPMLHAPTPTRCVLCMHA